MICVKPLVVVVVGIVLIIVLTATQILHDGGCSAECENSEGKDTASAATNKNCVNALDDCRKECGSCGPCCSFTFPRFAN